TQVDYTLNLVIPACQAPGIWQAAAPSTSYGLFGERLSETRHYPDLAVRWVPTPNPAVGSAHPTPSQCRNRARRISRKIRTITTPSRISMRMWAAWSDRTW